VTTEQNPAQDSDLPRELSNPARNALTAAGIRHLDQVAAHTEAEILKLHGVGPKTIPVLRAALAAKGLSFAGENAMPPA
jgi:hypothetical protein